MKRRAQGLLRWMVLLALVALLLGGAAVVGLRITRPVVDVTEVAEGPVVQAFYATGTLEALREFPINSNIEGTITALLVDKGSAVRKGQELARISSDDLQFKHAQARATRDLAVKMADEDTSPVLAELKARQRAGEEQLTIARRDLKRLEELAQTNATSQSDVDRARDRVEQFWSAVESIRAQENARRLELEKDRQVAESALEIAQWNLDQQTVRSPIDGYVLDRPISLGTRVRINDHLMQIADVAYDKLVMRAAVDEEDRAGVREPPATQPAGNPGPASAPAAPQVVKMVLYSFPGERFEGTVKQVYPKADPTRRTFEVDVAPSRPDPRFAAGMTGELAFIIEQKAQATIVPRQALRIQEGGGGNSAQRNSRGTVWVVRGGEAHPVEVRVGLRSVERAEILSGLQRGEKIVLNPDSALSAGQRVRIGRELRPAEAADLNKPRQEEAFRGFN